MAPIDPELTPTVHRSTSESVAAECTTLGAIDMSDLLLNHLVGAYQQPGRKFNPEPLRRVEVEGQLDSYGLVDR